ncbi:Cyclin-like F-box [Beauveria brongniartii RCEF 3172]|uniref:Cyclin-like F-box n=1 Tax=Beauveria brongniartii RCEF 3172 TaxID=1081107 RepID=A0A166ZDA4_9HYPO|nr:Cyclin-like F-box [Beauveria brongniartii RCEF 3172]
MDSSDEGSSDECEATSPSSSLEEEEDEEEEEEEEEEVSMAVVLQRLGRPELNEDTLRQALFRYALHKSYVYDGEGEAPQLWVMNSTKWKYQL